MMQQHTTIRQINRSILSNPNSTRIFVAAKLDFAIDGLLRLMKDSTEIKVLACVEPSERCWQVFDEEEPDLLLLHSDAVAMPTREFIMSSCY